MNDIELVNTQIIYKKKDKSCVGDVCNYRYKFQEVVSILACSCNFVFFIFFKSKLMDANPLGKYVYYEFDLLYFVKRWFFVAFNVVYHIQNLFTYKRIQILKKKIIAYQWKINPVKIIMTSNFLKRIIGTGKKIPWVQ